MKPPLPTPRQGPVGDSPDAAGGSRRPPPAAAAAAAAVAAPAAAAAAAAVAAEAAQPARVQKSSSLQHPPSAVRWRGRGDSATDGEIGRLERRE